MELHGIKLRLYYRSRLVSSQKNKINKGRNGK